MTPVEPIQSSDLEAYIDDQLTASRRIEVESYLSENPDVAARVMRIWRSVANFAWLCRAGVTMVGPKPARQHAAFNRPVARCLPAHVSANGGNGGAGGGRMDAEPALRPADHFQGRGLHACTGLRGRGHTGACDTSILRESMPSQAGSSRYDAAEIRSATAIVIPQIPKEWKVSDVQIFPSAFGPSVEMSLTDEEERSFRSLPCVPASLPCSRWRRPAKAARKPPTGRLAKWPMRWFRSGRMPRVLARGGAPCPLSLLNMKNNPQE